MPMRAPTDVVVVILDIGASIQAALSQQLPADLEQAAVKVRDRILEGGSALLDTSTITASALSPDCLEYRVVGICYWLR